MTSYCYPHWEATYFCLESVWKLDLSGSLLRCLFPMQRSEMAAKILSENHVVTAKKVKVYDSF